MDEADELSEASESSSLSSSNNQLRRKESVYKSAENVNIELNSLSADQCEDIIDFVLVYCEEETEDEHILQKRQTFENNLRKEGMILRYENVSKLRFVKIQSTKEVLIRYCDILKLRMPIKESHCAKPDNCPKNDFLDELKTYYSKIGGYLNITLDKNAFPDQKYQLTAEFSKDKQYLFDINAKNFFSTSVRSIVVSFILERLKFNEDEEAVFDVGIQKLLSEGVYSAAYPLHDGAANQLGSQRNLLLNEWAGMKNCLKLQPVDLIKNYFGVKVAMYFVWLGFYTNMLISASIIGLVSVAYGSWTDSWNNLVDDICTKDTNRSRIMMCPLCDTYCDYWDLFETCNYARISHFFDNNVTVVFSILMSFWSALYLGLWKRYSATITHNWGLTDLDIQAEHPRPQYLARLANAKKKKINIVTRSLEPKVPFWRIKFPAVFFSFSICLLWKNEDSSPIKSKRKQIKLSEMKGTSLTKIETKNGEKQKSSSADPKLLLNKTNTDYASIDFECTRLNKNDQKWNLKVASWNVAGLRSWVKKGGHIYIEKEIPDILCLSEVKCTEDQIPVEMNEICERIGYNRYWQKSEKPGYAGVALYTKLKPISVKYGVQNKEFDSEGRMITAEFEKFFLISVYVPNAGQHLVTLPKRMKWNKVFKQFILDLDQKKPVIVCGDMNVAHNEIDLKNPKTNTKSAGFTIEEREGMTDFLNSGFVDTFRHFYPTQEGAYTYWTFFGKAREKNTGWRLDYFIVSERLTDCICDNIIRNQVFGSDHCPICLFLRVEQDENA